MLFDMDGTLLDSEPLWLVAETQTTQFMGCTWGQEDQEHCLGGPVSRVVEHIRSKLDPGSWAEFSSDWVEEYLLSKVIEQYNAERIPWLPGARELVLSARSADLPLALVTNSPRAVVTGAHVGVIDDLGYDPFDALVVGDEVGDPKPHPQPFVTAAELLVDSVGVALGYMSKIGKGLKSAADGFEDLAGSIESRLVPRLRTLAKYNIKSTKGAPEIPHFKVIEIKDTQFIEGELESEGQQKALPPA